MELVGAAPAFGIHSTGACLRGQPGVASGQQPQPERCPTGIYSTPGEPALSALGRHPLSGERWQILLPVHASSRGAPLLAWLLIPCKLYLGAQYRSGIRNE